MIQRHIFYSFHYAIDNWRVQTVRNMGVIDGTQALSANKWEELKRSGDENVKKWIDENLKHRSCTVVLIGEKTASRRWVKYEIEKSWELGKGVIGIYIHKLKDKNGHKSRKGRNPFIGIKINGVDLSRIVPLYDPQDTPDCSAYNNIRNNLLDWVEEGIIIRQAYPGYTQHMKTTSCSQVKNTNGFDFWTGVTVVGILGFCLFGLWAYSKSVNGNIKFQCPCCRGEIKSGAASCPHCGTALQW